MKISHEVPISLLEDSKKFNNYDYILPHLLDKFEGYKDYMLKAKEEGRYLVMDNSLHELGYPYDTDRLLHWINVLEPNEFIVPDLWENSIGTLQLAEKWSTISLPSNVTKVAVVQSKNIKDTIDVYNSFKIMGYKKIAFSYGAEYYTKIMPHYHTPTARALGRLKVIIDLCNKEIIKLEDRIHLLGCSLPQEFLWYQAIPQIESIDTSNPIMAGIMGERYKDYGLLFKPKVKIDDVIDKTFDEVTLENIKFNVNKFRTINGYPSL